MPRQAANAGVAEHHFTIGEHVRAAYLAHDAPGPLELQLFDEICEHVADRDRLAARAHPLWPDHDGQPFGEIAHHLERSAARADDDRRTKFRDRNACRAQDFADLVTALEMVRQVRAVDAESAEIDDALYARFARRGREEFGRDTVAGRKVARVGTHRVHQVIGDVDAFEGAQQVVAIENVARDDSRALETTCQTARIAGEAGHVDAAREEARHEPASDVPGGSRYEDVHGRRCFGNNSR